MPTSQLDFRLMLSEKERIQFNEIIIKLAQVETKLAHEPDLVPLDVFLDWSSFTHKWLRMYTNDICNKGTISYRSFKHIIKELQIYHADFTANLKETAPALIVDLTSALQKAVNMWTEFTIASGDANELP